jgi:hypothetical protein
MKISNKITTAIKEKRLVKIYRNFTNEELIITGFILDSSDDFILLQNESDFLLDGYSIIRINDIGKIRYGKYEKYFEMMLGKEGFLKNIGIDYKVELQNLQSIFNSIKLNKLYVIAECQKENDGRFIIGPIESTNKKSVEIRYFDATGYLKKNLTKLKFKDITTIELDTRYLNYFSKYLRVKNKKHVLTRTIK